MKKKQIIIVIICILVVVLFIVGLYFYGLTAVSRKSDKVTFTINSGTSTKSVINDLYEAKIIKSKISTLIYVKLNHNIMIQAGTYELDRNKNTKEIFDMLKSGKVKRDTITITFIEGKRVVDYAKLISEKFGYTENDVIEVISDTEYLQELIKKYDFLDNSILNSDIYYPLEGYLFPATYEFYKNASIKDIIEKMLDKTRNILDNIGIALQETDYSVHEILTIASIIENESVGKKADVKYCSGSESEYIDRFVVSQVIYTRLKDNISLGMDVTTYYGARKALTEDLYKSDINAKNAYNTRRIDFIGLPVGPISNPSKASIDAAINPSDTDCVFFFADVNKMELHFAKTGEQFESIKNLYS